LGATTQSLNDPNDFWPAVSIKPFSATIPISLGPGETMTSGRWPLLMMFRARTTALS